MAVVIANTTNGTNPTLQNTMRLCDHPLHRHVVCVFLPCTLHGSWQVHNISVREQRTTIDNYIPDSSLYISVLCSRTSIIMPVNHSLRPLDVAALLHLYLHPGASYGAMAEGLGASKSSVHASVARLVRSGLASEAGRLGVRAAPGPAREFLQFGVPYAFPAETVPKARGIPTGFSAPPLRPQGPADDLPLVWPSRLGDSVGVGVHPLVPAAPNISFRDPRLYRLLALVDALRVGDARDREIARALIAESMVESLAEAKG